MKRASLSTWLGASLLLLSVIVTPVHLAIETHEWHHEASDDHEGHHHHGADQGPHPAVDHELTALAKAPGLILPSPEFVLLQVRVVPPDVRVWIPAIEPEANSPPSSPESPPRSPRAPPL